VLEKPQSAIVIARIATVLKLIMMRLRMLVIIR